MILGGSSSQLNLVDTAARSCCPFLFCDFLGETVGEGFDGISAGVIWKERARSMSLLTAEVGFIAGRLILIDLTFVEGVVSASAGELLLISGRL